MTKALELMKAQAGKLKDNFVEIATFLLIICGLPAVAYLYVDIRLAVTVFILAGIILGVLTLRFAGKATN